MNRLLPLLLLLLSASSGSFAGEGEGVVLVGPDRDGEVIVVTILGHENLGLSLGPAPFYGEVGLQFGHGVSVLTHVGLDIPLSQDLDEIRIRPFTGVAWSESDEINDGAHWNFASGLEVEAYGARVRWTHLSHADTGPGENPGFDAIMIGSGFRF